MVNATEVVEVRDRMQGVDCYMCEEGTPHTHPKRSVELERAGQIAEVILSVAGELSRDEITAHAFMEDVEGRLIAFRNWSEQ